MWTDLADDLEDFDGSLTGANGVGGGRRNDGLTDVGGDGIGGASVGGINGGSGEETILVDERDEESQRYVSMSEEFIQRMDHHVMQVGLLHSHTREKQNKSEQKKLPQGGIIFGEKKQTKPKVTKKNFSPAKQQRQKTKAKKKGFIFPTCQGPEHSQNPLPRNCGSFLYGVIT